MISGYVMSPECEFCFTLALALFVCACLMFIFVIAYYAQYPEKSPPWWGLQDGESEEDSES